jgi:peptidoglycan/LPS O-acetylase OafA/YrhL
MKKLRLSYLDSLRGLAAVAVAFFHYVLFYKEEILLHSQFSVESNLLSYFNNTIDLGKISVLVFFMISGFVIPYSIKSSGKTAVNLFVISRFFRLYPVYWLSVIIGVIIYNISWSVGLVNLTMFQQFIGVPNVIGLYWTLQIELVFYFLMIVLVLLKKNNDLKTNFLMSLVFLVIALLMSVCRFYFEVKLPVALPLALSVMFFGSYWRNFIINEDTDAKKKSFRYICIYIVVIPIIAKLAYDIDFGFHENWIKYVISYFSALAIFLFATLIKYSNMFFVFLGKISYSVYLFHPITFHLSEKYIDSLGIRIGGRIALHLILLIVFSYVTYNIVEKYSIQLGRKVKNKYLVKVNEQ